MDVALNVCHLAQNDIIPPWIMPCPDSRVWYRVSESCPIPGLEYEVFDVVARYLHLNVVDQTADENYTNCDMMSITRSAPVWAQINWTASSNNVFEVKPSVVICNKPIDDVPEIWSVFKPFNWRIWLIITTFISASRLYSFVVNKSQSQFLPVVRTFRPNFVATLMPWTFGLMLLTGLYRTQLLTNLILSSERFLIENIYDLANLPDNIAIESEFEWYKELSQSMQDDELKNKLLEKSVVPRLSPSAAVYACDAVYVTNRYAASYIQGSCAKRLRVVDFQFEVPVGTVYGFRKFEGHENFVKAIDKVVHHLRPLIEIITIRYQNLVPQHLVGCGALLNATVKRNTPGLDMSEVTSFFFCLLFGIGIATISLIGEIIKSAVSRYAQRLNVELWY